MYSVISYATHVEFMLRVSDFTDCVRTVSATWSYIIYEGVSFVEQVVKVTQEPHLLRSRFVQAFDRRTMHFAPLRESDTNTQLRGRFLTAADAVQLENSNGKIQ
jgi:hypothetical protein